jgi:hypothetical protein
VKSCLEAINFFGVVQILYAFFAASTHRWNLLLTGLKSEEKNKIIVLKTLSNTRWECHTESCKAIILNYDQIICTLTDIFENCNEKQENRHEAKSMKNKIIKFKTAFMWSEI